MANSVSFTGSDTLQINNRVLTTAGDQDVMNVEFPDDIANIKIGKDGNVAAATNASGRRAEVTLRLIRGGSDDKYLNSLRKQQESDLASFTALTCKLVKRSGDGAGNIVNDTYDGRIGMFKKNPGAKSNADGDTEQSMVIYTFHFGKMGRVIL